MSTYPQSLSHATLEVGVNGRKLVALMDSGSSDSYISMAIAEKLKLQIKYFNKKISMASKFCNVSSPGYTVADIEIKDQSYPSTHLGILDNLCCDLILGQDFQKLHKALIFQYNGEKPVLKVAGRQACCALSSAKTDLPTLFPNITEKCKPIATKSRHFSFSDKQFIADQVSELLSHTVIRESISPYRAQVVVVKDQFNRHKKRLCIDYSQTINLYTELGAYPLPKIEDMIHNLANYSVFSTFDLRSAYHQIEIKEGDRKYTAFEANGKLYEFMRIPFGITNGVAAFQRTMDKLVSEENLKDTFPYLDNVTIAGHTQEEHDSNVEKFLHIVKQRNFTLNESKTVKSVPSINVLGYCVGNKVIKPDSERLKPLQELPPPMSLGAQRRAVGLFAYYAKWIPNFSDKIKPLISNNSYPLTKPALTAFTNLKQELVGATLHSIDEKLPFVVECDASEVAVSAVLNQGGRPVAFMSRTLQGSELHYPAVEKEATAIIEAVRKWSHFLARQHFTLTTDQRYVAFMLDNRKRTKIKNNKILEWRLELASFSYTIEYRPGKENVAPDTLTRAFCCSTTTSSLIDIHNKLCHPGVTRLLHFVRSKNLPFSTEDVRRTCSSCKVCSELKPQFHKPAQGTLIKATQPMERLSIDFKGPLPSNTRNCYILTVIDEYSRFPFAFPCSNMLSSTVIKCLELIFSLCGMPSYIHSDRGSSFMSQELKSYLLQKGIASSRTTPYHSQGNGQCERYNAIIWNAIRLNLKSRNLDDKHWELVLPQTLHSIRSMLSTATNVTPHERFFNFHRRSTHGNSLPAWLMTPGSVLLRRFVRNSKNDPFVDQVELLECNPMYANIKYADGRESTVSVKDLAPCPPDVPQVDIQQENVNNSDNYTDPVIASEENEIRTTVPQAVGQESSSRTEKEDAVTPVRRSQRESKPPQRYGWN